MVHQNVSGKHGKHGKGQQKISPLLKFWITMGCPSEQDIKIEVSKYDGKHGSARYWNGRF